MEISGIKVSEFGIGPLPVCVDCSPRRNAITQITRLLGLFNLVATAYSCIRSQPSCPCVEELNPIKARTLSVVVPSGTSLF
ncbi:hypothetical protein AVEN_217827-1 [Araneus ventricosus]|uniref:Uncharacterized protein n=1 Tax=Araneus ventricosus TaxID=182803 RepID=A0A4Y2VRN3_ARAVE|nr:hypothetical protein AVEN_217827-1 [Araneus ventricosus]